jgi:carboxyl-terminal processing protease
LILDVRGNPGGLLDAAVEAASRFIEDDTVVITRGREGEEKIDTIEGKYANLNVPLCALVDEHSASASEILAGAIQDHGIGTVIGTKTYGKASVQVVVTLKNQGALAITTAKYLTPRERDISQTGITPDIDVAVSPEDRENGKDPQLQRAAEELRRQIAATQRDGRPARAGAGANDA